MKKSTVPILLVSCLCGLVTLAAADCDSLQGLFPVSETDPNGTILFNFTKPSVTPVSFTVKNDSGLSQVQLDNLRSRFFLLEQNATYFTMSLRQTLDLELLYTDFHKEFGSITLSVICDRTTYESTIRIQAVNEFNPIFINAPYNVSIPESLKSNDTAAVFDFSTVVEDRDIPRPDVFFYHIHEYLIPDLDGRDYFYFPATTQGLLKVLQPLDYDTMARKRFLLNVSVSDGNTGVVKKSYTRLTIFLTDADDQKPYFDFPNCGTPCVAPPYTAVVDEYHTGSLPIQPALIAAKDNDTLGTTLLFSIQGNAYGMFGINENTGIVLQHKSVHDSGQPNSVFRLIIQVRKDTPPSNPHDLSAIAILSVSIAGRQPNTTTAIPPREADDTTSSSSDLLIPVIILGILLALLIAAVILVFVLMRKKQRQMMVSPEHDKSEPQTEEEEIHDTDRSQEYNNKADMNEKLMFGKGKTTRAVATDDSHDMYPVPTERAFQLPPLPLRDSATETTEIRKKKRSRKRNKNKEPEIFDGTREYNMGLDPEFFEDSDKSRVKRSQRSKKADSSLPINVPNDQPPEDDHEHVMHM